MGDGGRRPRAGLMRGVWRAWTRLVRLFVTTLFGVLLLALGLLFFNYVVVATPKDRAYRNLDPAAPVCAAGLAQGWTAIADRGLGALGAGAAMEGDGWHDLTDDETAVVAADPSFATKLRCAIQRHVVPARRAGGTPIDFTLGFLEFKESGEPYALVADDAGHDAAIGSAMLKHAMEVAMHANGGTMAQVHPVITQLDALQQRLRAGANYVLVFIHGWRHDASIGDQDVADARLYAAHAVRFLAERCRTLGRDCTTKVTAIYVGWRGARVDERALSNVFGQSAGKVLSAMAAGSTLFDRKPVAEAIAPSAISALHSIEGTLAAGDPRNRMIVIGHSLGGDMLATGLNDDLLRAVDRHQPGAPMPPVLGNLVVLVNPAAEARKWTDIQRETFARQAVRAGQAAGKAQDGKPQDGMQQDGKPQGSAQNFFPPTQRPSVVSVTSALAFPPGGLRPGDCAWIGLDVDDRFKRARELIRIGLAHTDDMFTAGVDYDFATHDLFPTFKLDFRPAAAYLDRVAARLEHRQPSGESCKAYPAPSGVAALMTLPIRALSSLAATFPFQATAVEDTHTIGNLDPPRPPAGVLADAVPSAAPYGTTHEMLGLHTFGAEHHNPYATLADAPLDCPATDGWLMRARAARADQDGLFWDSAQLAPAVPAEGPGQGMPTVRFLHGLPLAGSAPITGADDPFWNIRAFDNALSRHDGYRLSSFICAINALVMDDITPDRPVLRETTSPARQPGSAVLN